MRWLSVCRHCRANSAICKGAGAQRQITAIVDNGFVQAAGLGRQLTLLSHESVLQRGFALVLDSQGRAIRRAADAPPGTDIDVRFAGDDALSARVTGTGATGSGDTGSGDAGSGDTGSGDTGSGDTGRPAKPRPAPSRKAKNKPADDGQGELL